MNILDIIFWPIIVAIIIILGYLLYKWIMANQNTRGDFRMLVAIKRRQAGISRFIQMDVNEQAAHIKELEREWQALNNRFMSFGIFAKGFTTSGSGLPSGGEEDWAILGIYDLPDHDAFLNCKDVMDDDQFTPLRNHCDIRLISGERMESMENQIRRLF
ncbi:MAG: hypothetical protein GXO75_20770 [Calditrichaeota bacterium]|nr:hypothetical protein [Calditrichota bacterium]